MLNNYDKDLNITQIEKQFQLIIEQRNENSIKNILPFNPCRVLSSTDRKQINASYIHVSELLINF